MARLAHRLPAEAGPERTVYAAFRAVSLAPHLPLQGDVAECLVWEPSRWPIGLRPSEGLNLGVKLEV